MPTIDQRIPRVLTFVTALAMLAITGWQGYQFWQTEAGRTLPTTATTVRETQPESSVPDVKVADLALFGTAVSTQSMSEPDTENLPETDLRLVLRGALAADDDFPGSALIEDSNGETDVYVAGDSLPGNALLRTVLPNRVILERDGKLENLYFPETDDRQAISLASEIPAESAASSEQSPADRQNTDTSADEQARREEIRSRLQQLRQRLQDNN